MVSRQDFLKFLKEDKEQVRSDLFKVRDLQARLPKGDYFSKNEIDLLEKELRLLKEFWFLENKIKKLESKKSSP